MEFVVLFFFWQYFFFIAAAVAVFIAFFFLSLSFSFLLCILCVISGKNIVIHSEYSILAWWKSTNFLSSSRSISPGNCRHNKTHFPHGCGAAFGSPLSCSDFSKNQPSNRTHTHSLTPPLEHKQIDTNNQIREMLRLSPYKTKAYCVISNNIFKFMFCHML